MKVAIYSRSLTEKTEMVITELIGELQKESIRFFVYNSLAKEYRQKNLKVNLPDTFSSPQQLQNLDINYMISVGGDGTMLDTVTLIRNSGIPVIGINAGRLGFLAGIPKEKIRMAITELVKGHFTIDQRSLLLLDSSDKVFQSENYALNDFVIYKNASSSMIVVHTFLNGEYLNSYWSDGLIISTPTGSTGYSLSCGGPILFPKSSSFCITPIAPHNLNVRPIIVSDENVISFEVEGRASSFMASLDARTQVLPIGMQLAVKKADFQFNLLKFNNENYLETIRSKLMWGIDHRN
jgi:NAD+ kinase